MSILGLMRRRDYSPSSSLSETERPLHSRVALLLVAILVLAFVLRVGAAVVFPNMEVSDETFATREAAHRLAYGYGLINPDWREGLRSWAFPAFLAGVMRATDWMGAGSSGYLLGIMIVLSLISLTTVWFSFIWAYRTSGVIAAVVAAGTSAIWYELVYYGPKAFYEVVAAHVLLPGLYLGAFGESIPERKRLFISGLLCGLAIALRPPLAPAVLFAAVALSLKNPRVRLPAVAAGILAPVVVFGIVDAFTWSYPFHSFISFFRVNVINGAQSTGVKASSQWIVESGWYRPWYWFLPVLAKRLGPMVLIALIGVRRSPFLGWVALLILLTHSIVGHKEFRFIYPMIPIAVTLAGLGVAEVLSALRARSRLLRSVATACVVGLIPCVCISAALAWLFPLWSRYSGQLISFQVLSRDAKACGVALVGSEVDPTIGGGYTYLHRNVPIFFFPTAAAADAKRLAPSFNAIVTALPLRYAGFEPTRCWNGTCLHQGQGPCIPSPGDEVKFLPVE
jgi:GPI mannosyltransferase 3